MESEVKIGNAEQLRVALKTDTILKRRQRFQPVLATGQSVWYQSPTPEISPQQFSSKEANELFGRACLTMVLDGIESGLDPDSYASLIHQESLGEPPKYEDPSICPDGHNMLRRRQHWMCPPCDFFKWDKPL